MGVLILFAGLRRPNSIKNWLIKLSAQYNVVVKIEDFDILNGPEHDLVDDLVARKVLHWIDEETFRQFSCPHLARRSLAFARDFFEASQAGIGMDGNVSQRTNWRQSSVKPRVRRLQHVVRNAHWSLVCRGWSLPAEHSGKSHMLQLDDWSLHLSTSLHRVYLDQCHFGSIYKKPTILVGTLPVAKLSARLLKRADRIDVFNETDALAPDGYPAELCKQLAHKILL